MTVTHLLNDTGNTALWVAGAAIVIWIIQYSFLADWWKHAIGITLIGLALVDLAIYVPPLMALADPRDFAHFAATTWYLCLTVGIVVASAAFVITRIIVWERLRRERKRTGRPVLPVQMADRIAELEAQVAACKEQHGGVSNQ